LAIAMILPKEFSKAREGIYHSVLHMQLVSRETVFFGSLIDSDFAEYLSSSSRSAEK
jgi:hypothetical protein